MSWFYRQLIRPMLFTQSPESIHDWTIASLGSVGRREVGCDLLGSFYRAEALPVSVWGLTFPNPVGLAAGMDKEARALPAWEALGFGFTELGAVTWEAQPGNPPPRVFRAVSEGAIVNRMGFNNPGAESVAEILARWRARGRWPGHPVGMNLGKSKSTPLARAAEDYAASFRVLWPHLDFFVVNVSSPNTPGLRELQDRGALTEILAALQEVNRAQSVGVAADPPRAGGGPKPVLVKVAPDLSWGALDEVLSLIEPCGVAGVVATNTTLERPESARGGMPPAYRQAGGLSGRPLRARSTEVVRHVYRQTRGRVPIIGVGGIFSAADAWEKVAVGATLVQVYTGLVYEGPGLIAEIVSGLNRRLAQAGLTRWDQAVGIEAG